MTLRPFCEEFCRIKFFNMFKILATTLRHLATHARKLRITGDCFETALRATRDVCRQLSQNSRSSVRQGLVETYIRVWKFKKSVCQLFFEIIRSDTLWFSLQPCYNQLSKKHSSRNHIWGYSCHAKINNLPYSDRYFNTGWQFEMLKRGKPMDMILSVYFKKGFLYSSNICCWYILKLPHRGNSNVHLQHMSLQ